MKIAVISDSHKALDKLKFALKKLKKYEPDLLLHAGDFVTEKALEILEDCGVPYYAVFGNNDRHLYHLSNQYRVYREPFRFMFEDLKIKMMHLPNYIQNDGADLIVFGHTHIPYTVFSGGALFINPGEVCARDQGMIQCSLLIRKKNGWKVKEFSSDGKKWKVEKRKF